jgi:hypothetical protein
MRWQAEIFDSGVRAVIQRLGGQSPAAVIQTAEKKPVDIPFTSKSVSVKLTRERSGQRFGQGSQEELECGTTREGPNSDRQDRRRDDGAGKEQTNPTRKTNDDDARTSTTTRPGDLRPGQADPKRSRRRGL